jgi:uncharacterized protein with GYD domain
MKDTELTEYKVLFYYEEEGITSVQAINEMEAEKEVKRLLDEGGTKFLEYKCTDRVFDIIRICDNEQS